MNRSTEKNLSNVSVITTRHTRKIIIISISADKSGRE